MDNPVLYYVDQSLARTGNQALTPDQIAVLEQFYQSSEMSQIIANLNNDSAIVAGKTTLNLYSGTDGQGISETGERIRDKIAASKKKGMWMGGFVPLGYDLKERKLRINAGEAKTVRHIYQRYLELGCVRMLQEEFVRQGIRSKSREQGDRPGGGIMSRGALYKILSNPIYVGQIQHKGVQHAGQHEAIIDQVLWDQVQQHLAGNTVERKTRSRKTAASLLIGKLFDASGEHLTPSHAVVKGRRYRYYISYSLVGGKAEENPEGWRLPAHETEQTIIQAAKNILDDRHAVATALQEAGIKPRQVPVVLHAIKDAQSDTAGLMDRCVQRVELQEDGIRLTLSLVPFTNAKTSHDPVITRDIPMKLKRRGVEMRLVIASPGAGSTRVDETMIKTIASAYAWFQDLLSGQVKNLTEIASREGIDRGDVNKRLSLAFLAPGIVEAIIAGHQPADLVTDRLVKHIDLPLDWVEQRRVLGFA